MMPEGKQADVSRIAVTCAVVSGLMMLFFSVIMFAVMPITLQWMPHGFTTPILALEFLPDLTSARQLLAQDTATVQAFIDGVRWDMAFLACYGAFLFSCAWVLLEKGVLRYIAIGFAVLAPLADIAENLQLLTLLTTLQSKTSLLSDDPIDFLYLRLAVVIKFGAIAILQSRLMRPLWQRPRLGRLLVVLILVNTFATGACFLSVAYAVEVMMSAIALCWLLLWVMMVMALRGSRPLEKPEITV